MRGTGQLRGVPQPGGERYRGGLIRLKIDIRQLVVPACDAVTLACVEPWCAPSLQRDAQLAQLRLVPLEHPEERLVGRGLVVAGHGRPDPLSRQVLAGGQQAEHQVDQTLGAGGRHLSRVSRTGTRAWEIGAIRRVGITARR